MSELRSKFLIVNRARLRLKYKSYFKQYKLLVPYFLSYQILFYYFFLGKSSSSSSSSIFFILILYIQIKNIKKQKMENAEVQTKLTPLYNITNNQDQYYAPFMVKSKRFKQNKQQSQIPAIGTYNLPSCFERKKSPFEDRMDRFFLQAQKKKEQLSMFKSSFNRFDKIYKQVPGPASYNLFKNTPGKQNLQFKKNIVNEKKIIDNTKTFPSIPFKDNKYGYAFAEDKFKTIQKGLDQLQLEKQSRKQYIQTLKDQMSFKRQNQSFSHSQNDFKKKLYQTTQKIVPKQNIQPSVSQKSINFAKKPKIQHLNHSKGVPVNINHKLLGPGQYDIKSKDFDKNTETQKFQFFGSTQVRFKTKLESQNKGYTIIEMLRQGKKIEKMEKKSPIKHTFSKSREKVDKKSIEFPGPGQYNPNHEHIKINKGNTFFPQSERFKQMYAQRKQLKDIENADQINELQRKNIYSGSLKKDRFKHMQKVYQAVKSSEIKGILSENKKAINKIQGFEKQSFFQNEEINSWSQQQRCINTNKKGYIKQLKEQLQIIIQTPRVEDQMKNKIKIMKQRTDKIQKNTD